MTLKRNNILSLIGNNRYHSCILTTYSFDFCFFEMKVMKWLRSCGVRNTNVFIDGHFYSELMQQTTGEEMTSLTSYSLFPMFKSDILIFHPKILMLFGEKEGLLIVGSGNLTNSGNGSNDEIWGAYHFDVKQPQNGPIFSAAWNYISNLSVNTKGFIREKTNRWITEHSQWLMELPKIENFKFTNLPSNESVAFLYNSFESTIWQEVKKLIENEDIVEITAVSPYYDLQGKALETIKSEFPHAKFNVILDEKGIIPSSLLSDNGYSFYDWKELGICRPMGANQQSRLHAKILHFKTLKNVEYCLLGSSNITPAGLGISNKVNSEVSLFIKSIDRNLLNEIGLKLETAPKKALSEFIANKRISIEQEIIKNNYFSIKLFSAEYNYNTLTLYSSFQQEVSIIVAIFNKDDKLIKSQSIETLNSQQEIQLDIDEDQLRYVQFQDIEGKNISNKIIVSNYLSIVKTHPNLKNAEFEKLSDQLQNGELRKVLELIHYIIIDESEKEDGASILSRPKYKVNETANSTKEIYQTQIYDLSRYKPVEDNSNISESTLLWSPSTRVLDALKLAYTNKLNLQIDIRIDEQEENINYIRENKEEEVKLEKSISLQLLTSDKGRLKKFFKNFHDYIHYDILFKGVKLSDYKLTLTDVTKYLIGLELIHEFGGKLEKIEHEHHHTFFTYLPSILPVINNYENDNVKGCCLNIVGDILRLAKNGFKKYTFEYTSKKFEQLKYDALISTIVCVINIHWEDDEKPYFKTLLLNALYYLGWRTTTEIDENLNMLILQIIDKAKLLKQKSNDLESQLSFFTNQVCSAFKHSIIKIETSNFVNKASKGQIIYSSVANVGYCYVVSVSNENEYCLARPGFDWNKKEKKYINHFKDTVYRPLPLQRLIRIDL